MAALTVTFQPNGTAVPNKVFVDFGLLCAYIQANGMPTDRWTIQLDGSFNLETAYITSGTYVLPAFVTFIGLVSPQITPDNNGYPTLSGDDVVFVQALPHVPLAEISFFN